MHYEIERVLAERDRFTGNYKLLEDFYRSTLESSVVRFYSDQAVRFGNVSMGRADIQAVSEVVIGMSASGLSPVAAMKSVVWDIGSGAGYATKELYAMAAMAAAVLGGSVGSELDGWEGAQFGYFPSREDFMSAIVGETSAASVCRVCISGVRFRFGAARGFNRIDRGPVDDGTVRDPCYKFGRPIRYYIVADCGSSLCILRDDGV
jgi:hypothetical protein